VLRHVPYLRVANVQRGHLDLDEVKTIEATEAEVAELRLLVGDILLNEGGDRDKLGRGWIWEGQLAECIHQNHVFRARPIVDDLQSKYVSHYANHLGQSFFIDQGKQTTNLASVSMSRVRRFPIALPPAREQAAIIELVNTRFARTVSVDVATTASAKQLTALDGSMLATAFRGGLVAQDPSDEPAELVLARVLASSGGAPTAKLPRAGEAGGTRTKTRVENSMLTRKDVPQNHLSSILKQRGALTAEVLWKTSQLDIDAFYEQLKDEEARSLLRENRGDSANDPRLLESAT
jgi:type I restriction enzyme S subunit